MEISPLAIDPVQRPLQVLDERFQQACQHTAETGPEHLQDCSWAANFFATVFDKPANESSGGGTVMPLPPWLNERAVCDFPPNTLVRFCGIVQDLLDPEYYGGIYRTASGELRTGAFRERVEDDFGENVAIWERKLMVITPIEFESEWAKARYAGAKGCPLANPTSRNSAHVHASTKRDRRMEGEAEDDVEMETDSTDNLVKRSKNESAANEGCGCGENAPIWASHLLKNSCLVKVYNQGEFKLGDVVEGLAILSRSPESINAAANNSDGRYSGMEEANTPLPSESLLPRLQAVRCSKIMAPGDNKENAGDLNSADIRALRDTLVHFWSLPFGCDRFFAEQILLSCFSKVSDREKSEMLIGKSVLNIWDCPALESSNAASPDKFATQLLANLRAVFPYVQYLPLSLKVLESGGPMLPKKDYETNRLVPGKLLLPQGCVLVIDERSLSEGKLGNAGCQNLEAVRDLCANLKIDLDFQYYKTSLAMDISIIIVSQARCRLLPSDSSLRLRSFTPEALHSFPMPVPLEKIRSYVRLCTSLPLPSIDITSASQMESELVKTLQGASGAERNISKLSFWITCVRLLARSYGEESVSMERWHQMRKAEDERLSRDSAKAGK